MSAPDLEGRGAALPSRSAQGRAEVKAYVYLADVPHDAADTQIAYTLEHSLLIKFHNVVLGRAKSGTAAVSFTSLEEADKLLGVNFFFVNGKKVKPRSVRPSATALPGPCPRIAMCKAQPQGFFRIIKSQGGGGGDPSPKTLSPPSPDQSDHRGKKRNLQLGKSGQAIFGTPSFGSKTPSPPPQTKVTIAGKNEIYNWENLVRPFLVHQVLGPKPPPPLPPPPRSKEALPTPWLRGTFPDTTVSAPQRVPPSPEQPQVDWGVPRGRGPSVKDDACTNRNTVRRAPAQWHRTRTSCLGLSTAAKDVSDMPLKSFSL